MAAQLGLFTTNRSDTLPVPDGAPEVLTSEAVSWKSLLQSEFQAQYYQDLRNKIKTLRAEGVTIYPSDREVFSALSMTPFTNVKLVILGQDPYHGPNQAHGLCFSVKPGVSAPPSLINIFKELNSDLGLPMPRNGCLSNWARQGVLLLNAVLTVEAGKPGSFQNQGWEKFTDRIVALLNERRSNLVFLLWGAYAQQKGAIIDPKKHLILKAPHPSPFSANRGFLGCRHFSKANQYLRDHGIDEIDWRI